MNGRWIRVEINAQSMRDENLPATRDPGEVRVLCLGDSFTFGSGIEQHESYSARMQELFGAAGDAPAVRVLNGGANGWYTKWQRLFLEKHAEVLDPDIVVLAWNWNDLNNLADQESGLLLGDGCWFCRLGLGSDRLRATHLYRFVFGYKHGEEIPTREALEQQFTRYRQAIADLVAEAEPDAGAGAGALDGQAWRESETPRWREARLQIQLLRDFVAGRGARLVVAMLPEPTWEGPGGLPAARRLAFYLDHLGVPWLDLMEDFLAEGPGGERRGRRTDLWLEYDWLHPSPAGHAIEAQRIAAFLRERGLLERARPPSE
jgi:lysophospholipase L1-like esterase